MSLTAFEPKTEIVELPGGGSFAVRGLSLEDFTVLLRAHYEPISTLFDRYVAESAAEAVDQKETGGVMGLGDVRGVVLEALEHAPGLIGDVIARAAGETENPHRARLLPMGVQIDAIEKVIRLTLDAEGGLEKLVETVSRLAGSLTELTANRSR